MELIPFLPPLLVFIIGLLTHRILLALAIGLGLSALIASDGNVYETITLTGNQLLSNLEYHKWDTWRNFTHTNKMFVVVFVLAAGAMFDLMKKSGGIEALIHAIGERIRSKKMAETTSLILSHFLFIDGCLSSITVSSIMRPIGDRLKVPRVKTAFLADSMAGPLVALCPFSCFTALMIGLLSSNGVGLEEILIQSPANEVYLLSIPYMLYSFSTIAVLWFVVRGGLSFGPMKNFEENVEGESEMIGKKGSIADFLLPIALLPTLLPLFYLLMTPSTEVWWDRITDAPISFILMTAAVTSYITCALFYVVKGTFSLKETLAISYQSCKENIPILLIIFLAWSLASILKDHLGLGHELANFITRFSSPAFLPFILFSVCAVVSIALGTSWGTVAIFTPLVPPLVLASLGLEGPLVLSEVPLLLPSLGGVISGAVLGDHVSLLSDSSLLASAGARCHPVDHIKTQAPYAIPTVLATSSGFLFAGFLPEAGFFLPLVLSISISLFLVGLFHLWSRTAATSLD